MVDDDEDMVVRDELATSLGEHRMRGAETAMGLSQLAVLVLGDLQCCCR
jgi:hypothetical protein